MERVPAMTMHRRCEPIFATSPHRVMMRILFRYIDLCARRPVLLTLLLAGTIGLSVWTAKRIRVDPDISALLPDDSPDRAALKILQARTKPSQPLILLAASSDTSLNRKVAAKLADAVTDWPETRFAIARRDPASLWERRLLFAPAESIDAISESIDERVRWERCQALPGCFTLDEAPVVPDEDAVRESIISSPETAMLLHLLGGRVPGPAGSTGQHEQDASGDLCTPDGNLCAVEASIEGDPANLAFADTILARVDALFAQVRPANVPADLRLVVSGAYRNAPIARRMTTEDLKRASIVTGVLMFTLLLVWYRSIRALLFLNVPLMVGLTWTAGFVAVVDHDLNILTAFTLGILGGLGVEYGIHILAHWRTTTMASRDPAENRRQALLGFRDTILHLGGSMVIAVVTTASGFLSLVVARFRGFSEMGALAAVGVLLTLSAFIVVLPIMARWFGFFSASTARAEGQVDVQSRPLAIPPRLASVVAMAGVAIGIGFGLVGRGVGFERDFRKLQPAEISHGLPSGSALRGSTRRAVFMLGESQADLEIAATALRTEGPGPLGDAKLPWILTARSFVPADQPTRLEAVARLRKVIDRALRSADEKSSAQLNKLRALALVSTPIEASQMPPWVRDWLFERNGRFGTIGLIYTELSGSDAGAMQILHERMAQWRKRFPKIVFASAVAQLGEVIPGLAADAPMVFTLALAGLALSTLLVSRSWRRTLLVLIPLGLATAIGLGIMALFGLKVNLYNLIVFPLFLGISIDGSVYVVWAFEKGVPLRSELTSKIGAISISTLTNMSGFAGMLVARNPGIASLGKTALIMLGSAMVVNVLWLPCLMLTVGRSRKT
jgi:uncharacterized protein